MQRYWVGTGELQVDWHSGTICSLIYGGRELIAERLPLFTLGVCDGNGRSDLIASDTATEVISQPFGALYRGLPNGMEVLVEIKSDERGLDWNLRVRNTSNLLLEWVDFPTVCVPPLLKNGGIGTMLYPYNEGVLVEDAERRERSWFPSSDPRYPSLGAFTVFPNMLCSQFMCYLFEGNGLYIGAHDATRGVKSFDFRPHGNGLALRQRLYCGGNAGDDFVIDYPLRWQFFHGDWQDGAELYRAFFEEHLPLGACKIGENRALPDWYSESPLIVTYPVRGEHDTDEMQPNALFPYTNALPVLQALSERTGSRVMALLMHWEGTAPWAPPKVLPPYGGMRALEEFRDALHRQGNLLGVYCSGFGYTLQSRLVETYRCELSEAQAEAAMCADHNGRVQISRICTAQRRGYDICPASAEGRRLLDEAYLPLFGCKLDYVQILDQNHGGGQYFCHSPKHGHPSAPGRWMTERMQSLLEDWHRQADGILLGCESAAAEPFIGQLQLSDNRYELNYRIGVPVPLYAYLYHEYVRNFMGNQCCCPFLPTVDTLPLRLAYSFAAGDCMTLVLQPNGELSPAWGTRDFSAPPNKETALTLIRRLTAFLRSEDGEALRYGKMCRADAVCCTTREYPMEDGTTLPLPDVFSTAWKTRKGRMQILVNHTCHEVVCMLRGTEITVPPLRVLAVFG